MLQISQFQYDLSKKSKDSSDYNFIISHQNWQVHAPLYSELNSLSIDTHYTYVGNILRAISLVFQSKPEVEMAMFMFDLNTDILLKTWYYGNVLSSASLNPMFLFSIIFKLSYKHRFIFAIWRHFCTGGTENHTLPMFSYYFHFETIKNVNNIVQTARNFKQTHIFTRQCLYLPSHVTKRPRYPI